MAKAMAGKTDVSLFPFLSILCALIGVLVLILVALTVGQVENTKGADGQEDIHISDVILESLEVERLVNIKIEDKDPHRILERVRTELDQLLIQAKALDPDLLKREVPLSERILVEPTGSGANRKAYFIECTEYAVIIPEDASRIGKLDISKSRKLREILDRYKVAMKEDYVNLGLDIQTTDAAPGQGWDVIFLIRPDGVETFKMAEEVAKELEAKYAAIPLPGYAPLNLTMFGVDKR